MLTSETQQKIGGFKDMKNHCSVLTGNHPGKNIIRITSKAHLGRVSVESLHAPAP